MTRSRRVLLHPMRPRGQGRLSIHLSQVSKLILLHNPSVGVGGASRRHQTSQQLRQFSAHLHSNCLCAIILRLFAMFLHNLHSHCEEIGTEHLIRIRIAKKFGSPNIPNSSFLSYIVLSVLFVLHRTSLRFQPLILSSDSPKNAHTYHQRISKFRA